MVSQLTEMTTICNSNNGRNSSGSDILKMVQAANKVTPLWSKLNRNTHIANRRSNFLLNNNNNNHQQQQYTITEQKGFTLKQIDSELKKDTYVKEKLKDNETSEKQLVVYWNDQSQEKFEGKPSISSKNSNISSIDGNNQRQIEKTENIDNNNIFNSINSEQLHKSWPYLPCDFHGTGEEISIDDHVILDNGSICEQNFSNCSDLNPNLKRHHLKPVNIVRRNSSTDSGIVMTTPIERRKSREMSLTIDIADNTVKRADSIIHSKIDSKDNTLNQVDSKSSNHIIDNTNNTVKCANPMCRSNSTNTIRKEFIDRTKLKQCCRSNSYPSSTHSKEKFAPKISNPKYCNDTEKVKNRNEKLFDISNFMHRNSKTQQNLLTRNLCNRDVDEDFKLVTMSCDVNNRNNKGNTCLHHASSTGDVETLKFLLKNGGNVWLKNNHDELPLDVCTDFNTAKVLSEATLFYTDNKSHKKDCNISSTFQIAFDL